MDYFLSGIYMILLGRGIIFQAEGFFFLVEKGDMRTDIRSVGTTYPYTTVDPTCVRTHLRTSNGVKTTTGRISYHCEVKRLSNLIHDIKLTYMYIEGDGVKGMYRYMTLVPLIP